MLDAAEDHRFTAHGTPTMLEAEQPPLARWHGRRVRYGDGAKENSRTSTGCIAAAVPMEWRGSNQSKMESRSSEETTMRPRLKANREDSRAYCSPGSSMASGIGTTTEPEADKDGGHLVSVERSGAYEEAIIFHFCLPSFNGAIS